ncbi:outer membrane beta-barrel protein [Xanthocytophaga agilis]|uniref:Outer membrane beta-barrel protein n=1 Tax=Xanthocytophaga agilis TaxID=3048010 RepID=A0AAE3R9L9_9BACT|nr:outer membrane beta-barrel protein [Xanthocytophaga agilis]MDJ1506181.1 outer membrane beta-barrel protein [Xanthocytophaga agilis]
MKRLIFVTLFWGVMSTAMAFNSFPEERRDSIIILLGKKTRIAIQTTDKAELQALRNYDLNALVNRVIEIQEKTDTRAGKDTSFVMNGDTVLVRDNQVTIKDTERGESTFSIRIGGKDGDVGSGDSTSNSQPRVYKRKRTSSEWYFDLGLDNYLTGDGKFPEQNLNYTLRPLGSRYVAISHIYKTRIGGSRSPLSLTYGLEASFYNYMFDSNTRIEKGVTGVEFVEVLDGSNVKDLKKSKLTSIYASIPVMPVLQFGHSSRSFRFGVGGFVGYRLHSYSKIKDSDGKKDHETSNFYLNNVRYGVQALVGIRGIDIFFKYDLNPLFTEEHGPDLRSIAFGFRF